MREGLHKIVSGDETIVAISTPLGRSAVGLVRVSGVLALKITARLFKASTANFSAEHRRAHVGIWTSLEGESLDEVVVTPFRQPNSYTGEDVVEISGHGSPFVLSRIVETIRAEGARIAAPGEFTLRAVSNGKIDLVQAEAVRDFIEAQTEEQAKIARRQMEGSISKRLAPLKEKLIDIIARLEAGIDFAEDDIDIPASSSIVEMITPVADELEGLVQTFGYGRMLAQGLTLAILGKPNVGKSSLFNRLVAMDRAIVAEWPGTTRDVVTETSSVYGIPIRFADTAGIRQTADRIESLGVARTFETLADADLALVVLDGSTALDSDDRQVLSKAKGIPYLVVINKQDLPQTLKPDILNGSRRVGVSAKTGHGIEELRNAIREFVVDQKTDLADDLVLTNARHHEAITKAVAALRTGAGAVAGQIPHEMVLLDLYQALSALNELTGETVTEDILDRIFATFCVGK